MDSSMTEALFHRAENADEPLNERLADETLKNTGLTLNRQPSLTNHRETSQKSFESLLKKQRDSAKHSLNRMH